jgi:OTT_1508-like deaminase
MAYHFANKSLGEEELKGIDELDSCAYTVLAALFSAVEPKLLDAATAKRLQTADRKKSALNALSTATNGDPNKLLEGVLTHFGMSGVANLNAWVKRVGSNAKLAHFWSAARTANERDFPAACALLLAHTDLANMPGDQCTAVVRRDRTLYVTGNGLWPSGSSLEEGGGEVLSASTPWFSSAQATQTALDRMAGSIRTEYQLDQIVFVIPMEGDTSGKFHAEMQLLDYMFDNRILPERGYMGVSKPCCTYCVQHLGACGIFCWNKHDIKGADPNAKVSHSYSSYREPRAQEDFRKALINMRNYGLHR